MQILKIKCALCKRGWGTSKKDDKNLSRMHLDDFFDSFVCVEYMVYLDVLYLMMSSWHHTVDGEYMSL